MENEKYNILEDPEQPTLGMEMQGRKSMFDFFAPTLTVMKIQALEFEDGKMWRRPENVEFKNGEMPDKEGFDELIIHSHKTRSGVHWLCWVNFKKFNVDKFLEDLYAFEGNEVEKSTKIYEIKDIATQYDTWEELFTKLDVDKIKPSSLITFCVSAKPHRKDIKNFNFFIDRVVESCDKKEPEQGRQYWEDLYGKWRYVPNETKSMFDDLLS